MMRSFTSAFVISALMSPALLTPQQAANALSAQDLGEGWAEECILDTPPGTDKYDMEMCCVDKERICDQQCWENWGPQDGGPADGTLLNCYDICRDAGNACDKIVVPSFIIKRLQSTPPKPAK